MPIDLDYDDPGSDWLKLPDAARRGQYGDDGDRFTGAEGVGDGSRAGAGIGAEPGWSAGDVRLSPGPMTDIATRV